MTTLEQDLQQERRRIEDLLVRARRRLGECESECARLETRGTEAAAAGNTKGAADAERGTQKLRTLTKRYESLVQECEHGGAQLASEVLLARLQGPEIDLLRGEVERNREALVQQSENLLRARDRHKALRQRWGELNGKLHTLRGARGLRASTGAAVEFRMNVTPTSYEQQPDGPTYREVADLLRSIGL